MLSLHGNKRDPRVNDEFPSSHFMVTKQTFELPVIWEAGVLVRPCDWETIADLSFTDCLTIDI